MNVLIIEDDKQVVDFISQGLKQHGHVVDIALDGKEGLFLATSEQYDAIVLDWMLPLVDGIKLLNVARASGIDTPILFLSAKGKVEDKVTGLRAGADDYLTKPFAFEELLARLEVMVMRSNKVSDKVTKMSAFDLELDLLSRQVSRKGEVIDLQAREFKLLEYLLSNKGQVVTRTMLLEHVWDYHFDPQTNIIDVHISRLRQKVDSKHDKQLIVTVRGAGYMIPVD